MSDWPQIKARLEEMVRLMPGESSTQSSRDIRAALQRVEACEAAFKRQGQLLAEKCKRVEELERDRAAVDEVLVEVRKQGSLREIDCANETLRAEAAEAKLANSEEGCRWLEAQIRDLEAKLARVVEALAEAYGVMAEGYAMVPAQRWGAAVERARAALAAAKGENR